MTMPVRSDTAIRYERISFSDLEGWDEDDQLAAFRAFCRSCRRLRSPADAAADTVVNDACAAALGLSGRKMTRAEARSFFDTWFVPHRLAHDGPPGFLTGYYEPLIEGSREQGDRFPIPVYRRPPDLENVVAETERGAKAGALTHVKRTSRGTEPYATRSEIEEGALAGRGLELVWLADAVDAFFLHVQGSGRIALSDGRRIRITYDGKNGHPYVSVGRTLIESGEMTADEMSLQSLGRWLRADAERGRRTMQRNPSFVFFRELEGAEADSALGAMDIPLTAGRSLAVDTSYHTLGTPIWVSSEELRHADTRQGGSAGLRRLMIAQDVGSAIRGPERGDIYFGSGARAGRLAGQTKHLGSFVVLLAKSSAGAPSSPEKRAGP